MQAFSMNSPYFQKSKVLAFIGIWIATHIHILEPGKDAKIPLWGLDLWVLNPQSPQNNEPVAKQRVIYILREKVGFELSPIRSLSCSQLSEDEA
jgi:hypothetical protein